MKNRYCFRSRISEKKIRQLLKLFALDLEATKIAQLSDVSRIAVNRYISRRFG